MEMFALFVEMKQPEIYELYNIGMASKATKK